MALLTNIRERVHICIEVIANYPDQILPSDSSCVISKIAIPKQDHKQGERIRFIVGEKYAFTAPLGFVMRHYDNIFHLPKEAAEIYTQIAEQFSVLIDAAQEGNLPKDGLEELRKLHRDLWPSLVNTGLELERAILIPPRQIFRIETDETKIVDIVGIAGNR